jgi:hypothetical protein
MNTMHFDELQKFAEQKARLELLRQDPSPNLAQIGQLENPEYLAMEQLVYQDQQTTEVVEGLVQLYLRHPAGQAPEVFAQGLARLETRLSNRLNFLVPWLKAKALVRHLAKFSWLDRWSHEHGYSKGLAVSVVMSLLLLACVTLYSATLTPDNLYRAYIQGLPTAGYPDGTTMGTPQAPTGAAVDPNSLKEMYRVGKFATVIERYNAQAAHSVEDNFYAGCAYLNDELLDAPKAVACFEKALAQMKETGYDGLEDDARYYLLFAYLRNQQADEASHLLDEIRADKAFAFRRDEVNSFMFYLKIKLLSFFN